MDLEKIPVGFGMALMQNEEATNAYAVMTKEEKQAVLRRAHSARTEKEMQKIISDIVSES